METVASTIRVHGSFRVRLDKYIKDFEEKVGIRISYLQATKLLDEKITSQGGLVV